MATLTGKIIDVTSRPPDSISSITVKAPSVRIGSGTEVITSSPANVDFNPTTGDVTISGLTGGLSWLYIEGDGWSDSIALSVAEGMITLVEAIANAAGVPGIADYTRLLANLELAVGNIAQDAVETAVDARMGDYTLREDVPDSGPNLLVHSATMSGWPGWGTNRSTANANGDDHSLFLQGNMTATSPRFPITSGEYVFTGSATSNASGSTTNGVLIFRDSAGNAVGEAPVFTADPIILPGWAEFDTTVTVPANTATVELKVAQTLTTTTAYVWYAWLGVRKASTIRSVLGSTVDSAARAESATELLTSRLAGAGEPISQAALATQTGNVLLGGDATSSTLRADYWFDFGHNDDATLSLGVPAAFWLHGTTMKNSGVFPIDRTGNYDFTVKVRGQHTGGTTSIRVNYLDADRAYINGDYPLAGAAVPSNTWATHTRTIIVPEGTKFVSISAWPNHSTGVQADDYVWYTDIGLRKVLTGGAGLRELADTTVTNKASVETLSRRVDALAVYDDVLPATPGSGMKLVPLAVTTGNIAGDTRPISRSYRVPVRWGAPILRWRLCITSRNPRFDTRLGADVTMPKITFGKHSSSGGFTEAPTLLATDVVVPGDGTVARLPWQNTPIEEGAEHIIGFDYTGTAEPFALCGGSWYLTDDGDAESLSPGTYRDHLTPFDMWIEAETWATTPVVAAVGDSLTSGAAATFQVLESWLSQYCRTVKALPVHYSSSGESAVNWVPDPDAYKIARWRDLARPDAVLWALGSNDFGGGRTFEQARDNTIQGLGIVRDEISPHIYGTTITPRNGFTPEQNAEREEFNQWILGERSLFRDAFDFSAVVEDQGQIREEFNGDGVHLNTAGYAAEAASITRPVTTPPVMYQTLIG